jgi:hypothetical protein
MKTEKHYVEKPNPRSDNGFEDGFDSGFEKDSNRPTFDEDDDYWPDEEDWGNEDDGYWPDEEDWGNEDNGYWPDEEHWGSEDDPSDYPPGQDPGVGENDIPIPVTETEKS